MKFKEFASNVSTNATIALWSFALVTIGLGVWSSICPPQGVIDKTILEFGCLMSFFATIAITREAIKEGRGIKVTRGDTTIETKTNKE